MLETLPKKLLPVAKEVHRLAQRSGALERFRVQVASFFEAWSKRNRECEDFREGQRQHVERINREPRLQDHA
jgi:enoyl-CoA hydratase/carnithine racemase